MLPRPEHQCVAADSPDITPPTGKRSATIKSRLISLRKHKKLQQQTNKYYTNIAMGTLADEEGYCDRSGPTLTIEVLKKEMHQKLLKPLKLLRTGSFRYMNVERDDLSRAYFLNDIEKDYALLWAAFNGQLEQLQYLSVEGADVNFVYPGENLNALHLAALSGSVECVQWLLAEKCRIINTKDNHSPLHFAVLANSRLSCHCLIESGCRIDLTALHAAVYANAVDCVKYLLHLQVPVNVFDNNGHTALHIASDLGNIGIVRQLLEDHRINVNAKTTDRLYTPLHLTAENGYTACTRMLLGKGAFVDELTAKKQTPLYLACKQTFVDCVELLLEFGAAVNVQDIERRTPLHCALSKSPNSLLIVRRLVDREADVNLADDYGYTALHIAALNELEECVEFLIIKGANVAAKTVGHVTALNIINRKTPVSSGKIYERLNLQLAYTEAQSLKFNFRDIIKNSTVGEIGYLYTLQKEGQAKVLEHPLCQGFLHLKWQKVRFFILLRAAVGLFTVTLLSVFVLWGITKNCYNAVTAADLNHVNSPNVSNSQVNLQANGTITNNSESDYDICTKDSHVGLWLTLSPSVLPSMFYIILTLFTFNIIRIFFTLAAYRSAKHFFTKYSNFLEIVVILGTFSLAIKDDNDKTYDWQKIIGGLTILFSWAYIMLIVAQLPSIGTYVAMFKKVLKEFLKMITAFLCLLVGFTLTFCAVKQDYFKSPISAFAKTLGMMTGELNVNDLMDLDGTADGMKFTTVFVMCLFMVSITIVLMNLLVGIAVNDVEGLRKTADLCKLIQQTKIIHFLEKTCFQGFFPAKAMDILKKCMYKWPNLYTVVLYVRPLSPHEKRLPRDVMEAGLKIALDRARKRIDEKNQKLSTDQRINSLEKRIIQLQDTLVEMQKSMQILIENGSNLNTIDEAIGSNEDVNVSQENSIL